MIEIKYDGGTLAHGDLWFTSDEHYDHFNVIEYDGRPFRDVFHMREEMIARHNELVKPGDTVIHLGDFCMNYKTIEKVLPRLHGWHSLVVGNHDRAFRQSKYVDIYKALGFIEVNVGEIIPDVIDQVFGQKVRLSHFPYEGDEREKYHEKRPKDDEIPLIHGHVHTKWKTRKTEKGTPMINVGVCQWDYRPVSVTQIKEILNELV